MADSGMGLPNSLPLIPELRLPMILVLTNALRVKLWNLEAAGAALSLSSFATVTSSD